MAALKNKDNGTWYVQFRYTDWKDERQQKLKRGFATKREAVSDSYSQSSDYEVIGKLKQF